MHKPYLANEFSCLPHLQNNLIHKNSLCLTRTYSGDKKSDFVYPIQNSISPQKVCYLTTTSNITSSNANQLLIAKPVFNNYDAGLRKLKPCLKKYKPLYENTSKKCVSFDNLLCCDDSIFQTDSIPNSKQKSNLYCKKSNVSSWDLSNSKDYIINDSCSKLNYSKESLEESNIQKEMRELDAIMRNLLSMDFKIPKSVKSESQNNQGSSNTCLENNSKQEVTSYQEQRNSREIKQEINELLSSLNIG